jgi:hypothetical protein
MSSPNHDEPWPFPIASHPGEREHTPRNNNILVNHWRHEPRRRCQLGHHLAFTKNAQEPNGIKLSPKQSQHQEVTEL